MAHTHTHAYTGTRKYIHTHTQKMNVTLITSARINFYLSINIKENEKIRSQLVIPPDDWTEQLEKD